ncbi:MAG: amidohydrolase family protein [Acidobacteria bacterium]|nr:amidohydrolase family protein [Acidobacteriota bacterium]
MPALLYRLLDKTDDPQFSDRIIDRVSMMKMMTTWPSYYVLAEDRVGSLAPGKMADFLVLNKDFFSVPLKEIPTVYPVVTVVGGKISVVRQEAASDLGLTTMGPQIEFTFETAEGGQFGGEG